jgi:RecG-like helicase
VGLAILVYCLLLFVDTTPLSDFVGRKNVEKSIAYRSEYDLIVQTIENNCSEGSKVYFVSENDEGLDLRIVRYSVRPVSVANVIKESRIATLPKSKKITPEEWMNTLTEGNFDYVAIHSVDEALGRDFGQCFENVDDIQPDTIFYLDKDRRLLVRYSG